MGVCGGSVLWAVCSDCSGQEEQNWCKYVLAAFQPCSLCSKAELSSARYCLGNGWGTHPAVLGIEAVSTEFVLLPSPVWESICTEKVCQSQKRSHRSFFPFCTSDLHISDCHVQSKRVHGVLLPIADKNWQYL